MTSEIPDPLFTLRGDMGSIHSLLFHTSGNSNYLYASTQAGIVHKWDIQKCREISRFKASEESCLLVTSLNKYLISQAKGGEIKVWEESNDSWELKTTMNTDYWGFCKLEVFRDELLVCPESGSKITVFTESGKVVQTITAKEMSENTGEVMAVRCFTRSEIGYIFILYESGYLALFSIGGDKISDLKISSDCPMAMDFDGDSKIVVGGSGSAIVGLQLTSDLKFVNWKETNITNPGVSCLAIRPDKKLFVAGCWDSRIRLFSMKSFKLLVVLQNHSQTIQDVRYSPSRTEAWNCESLLAAAGQDGRITLWSIY